MIEAGGASLGNAAKCNVDLKDSRDSLATNAVFVGFFPNDPPARTTVQTPLSDPEMLVEIEVIAHVD